MFARLEILDTKNLPTLPLAVQDLLEAISDEQVDVERGADAVTAARQNSEKRIVFGSGEGNFD